MDPDLLSAALLINQALAAAQATFCSICVLAHLTLDFENKQGPWGEGTGSPPPDGHQHHRQGGLPGSAKRKRKQRSSDEGSRPKRQRKKAGPGQQAPAPGAEEDALGAQAQGAEEDALGAQAPADSGPLWEPNPLESLGLEAALPTQGVAAGGDARRPWAAEEVLHLVQLVEDEGYRRRHLGLEVASFKAIAAHFRRTEQAARSKYYYWTKVERGSAPGGRGREKPVRRGISYGWMAVFGLGQLPGMEGTGEQVLREIQAHPPFQPLLDCSVRPDSAGVMRWKQRVREELSHRHCFVNTGRKEGGEAVWRLNLSDEQHLPSRRPPKDMAPFLGKHGRSNG